MATALAVLASLLGAADKEFHRIGQGTAYGPCWRQTVVKRDAHRS